jgi:hypothetical protein
VLVQPHAAFVAEGLVAGRAERLDADGPRRGNLRFSSVGSRVSRHLVDALAHRHVTAIAGLDGLRDRLLDRQERNFLGLRPAGGERQRPAVDHVGDGPGDVDGERDAEKRADRAHRPPGKQHGPRAPEEVSRGAGADDGESEYRVALADRIEVGRKLSCKRQRLLDHVPALAREGHDEHQRRHRDQPAARHERHVGDEAVGAPFLLKHDEHADGGDADKGHQ